MQRVLKTKAVFEAIVFLGLLITVGISISLNYIYGLVIIVAILCCFIYAHLFKYPERGLYLLIFSIPFQAYNTDLGFMTLSATNVLIIVITSIFISRVLLGYSDLQILRSKSNTFLYVILFLLFLSSLTSLFSARYILASLRYVVTTIGGILLFSITIIALNNSRKLRIALMFLLASVLVVSIVTILNGVGILHQDLLPLTLGAFREGHPRPIGSYQLPVIRNTGVMPTQGSYGIWVLSVLPLLFVSLFSQKARKYHFNSKVLSFIIFGIVLFGILITQSLNVWLGTLVAISVNALFLTLEKLEFHLKPAVISLLIVILILGSNFLISTTQYYINISGRNLKARISGDQFALALFLSSPLTGVGDETFEELFSYGVRSNVLHNTFLQFLITKGLLGFIPFVSLVVLSLVYMFRIMEDSRIETFKLLGLCLFSSLLAMITESMFFPGAADKGMWFLLGLANSLFALRQSNLKSDKKRTYA